MSNNINKKNNIKLNAKKQYFQQHLNNIINTLIIEVVS